MQADPSIYLDAMTSDGQKVWLDVICTWSIHDSMKCALNAMKIVKE